MPIKYGTPQENVDYSPVNEAETSSALWFVCSDRNNNTTYRQPNGNERFKTIQFLDKFYVIGEEGEYIRLAKGNSEDLEDTEDKISLNGEDYGWIHKKNVLLRKTPLACNHIPEKVVFFNTVKKGTSSIDIESNKYTHTNPNLDNKYKILPISLNDLFVYKEERNSLLLIRDK
ncbi:MAG: type VI secretion system protein TssR domain-containing protein, partial [Chitinophagales bacterium]